MDNYFGQLNALLAKGIVIPTIFGIDLSDIYLQFMEGYLTFGVSATTSQFWEYVFMGITMINENTRGNKIREFVPELFDDIVDIDYLKDSSIDLLI